MSDNGDFLSFLSPRKEQKKQAQALPTAASNSPSLSVPLKLSVSSSATSSSSSVEFDPLSPSACALWEWTFLYQTDTALRPYAIKYHVTFTHAVGAATTCSNAEHYVKN